MNLVVAAALNAVALREVELALGPGDVKVARLDESQLIEHAPDADAWLAILLRRSWRHESYTGFTAPAPAWGGCCFPSE